MSTPSTSESATGSLVDTMPVASAISAVDVIILPMVLAKDIFENAYVSSVISTEEFWMQMDSNAVNGMLETISKSEKHPKRSAKVGDTCLAPLRNGDPDVFFRAVVKDVIQGKQDMIRLFYVDYGYFGSIPISKLKLLPLQVTHQPALAVKCRLSGYLTSSPSLNSEFSRIVNPDGEKPSFTAQIVLKKKTCIEVTLMSQSGDNVMPKQNAHDSHFNK